MPVTTPGEVKDVELRRFVVPHQARQRHRGLLHRRQRLRLRGRGRREDRRQRRTPATRKRPGTTKYQDITLKRTLSPDKKFWNWAKSIRDGTLEYRTNGALVIYDMSGKELSRWTFNNVVAVEVVGVRPRRRLRRPDDRRGHAGRRRADPEQVRRRAMTDAKTHDADFQGSFFALEIDALTLAWFTGCSGLSLEFDVTTFKEGNGKKVIERKRPGKPKYSEVVAEARLHDRTRCSTTGSRRSSTPPKATPYKTASIVHLRPPADGGAPGSTSRRAGRRSCRSPTSAPAATT